MHENLSDTDFNSEKFDMSPLIKKLQENLRNLKIFYQNERIQ